LYFIKLLKIQVTFIYNYIALLTIQIVSKQLSDYWKIMTQRLFPEENSVIVQLKYCMFSSVQFSYNGVNAGRSTILLNIKCPQLSKPLLFVQTVIYKINLLHFSALFL